MKEELGLDHFEGRSWLGLHHHLLLTMMALCFLQYLRLEGFRRGEKSRGISPRPDALGAAARAFAPSGPPADPHRPRHSALFLPELWTSGSFLPLSLLMAE